MSGAGGASCASTGAVAVAIRDRTRRDGCLWRVLIISVNGVRSHYIKGPHPAHERLLSALLMNFPSMHDFPEKWGRTPFFEQLQENCAGNAGKIRESPGFDGDCPRIFLLPR